MTLVRRNDVGVSNSIYDIFRLCLISYWKPIISIIIYFCLQPCIRLGIILWNYILVYSSVTFTNCGFDLSRYVPFLCAEYCMITATTLPGVSVMGSNASLSLHVKCWTSSLSERPRWSLLYPMPWWYVARTPLCHDTTASTITNEPPFRGPTFHLTVSALSAWNSYATTRNNGPGFWFSLLLSK